MSSRTIYTVLEETASRQGDCPALCQPCRAKGEMDYRTYSWDDYKRIAQEIAVGLRELGLKKGDVVALDSQTRAEFYLADLGIMSSGCIAAALYSSYSPAERVQTLRECGARAVFVEGPETLAQLQAAADPPLPVRWFLLTGCADGVKTLEELRCLGRTAMEDSPELWTSIRADVKPDDCAILYLTSGATGQPKMALVSHAAVVANVDMGPLIVDAGREDRMLAFLPSAHITQRVVAELLPIRWGTPVWFSESLLKLPEELRSIQPTLFVAPPRLWERIYKTVCTEIRRRPAFSRMVFYEALGLGLQAARHRQQGKPVPRWLRLSLEVARRLVLKKLQDRFGGALRIAASGSAPLGKELAEFYMAAGVPLFEGYGLTEGGVILLNPLDRPKAGSIGKTLPGVRVTLAEDGELLVNSPTVFSGYLNDPEASAQIFRDDWLRTGDIAEIDEDGYVFITGRKKELVVMSNGKKVFPSLIENLFTLEPVISHVMLIGDRLPHISALVTLNPAVAESLEGMEDWQGRSAEELASAPQVVAEVNRAVKRVNRKLAPFEQIRKIQILPRDFTIENGELTATLKIRRARILENFRHNVHALYAGGGEAGYDLSP